MVQKPHAPPVEDGPAFGDESLEAELSPEIVGLIDQLVPRPHRGLPVASLVLLAAVIGLFAWSPWIPPNLWISDGGQSQSTFDEDRGLMAVHGRLSTGYETPLRVVDLQVDAPGAEFVEFELYFNEEPVTLPVQISKELDAERGVRESLRYVAWFEPRACEVTGAFGVVTATLEDVDGQQHDFVTDPFVEGPFTPSAIPQEHRGLGADLLAVACEVLR